MSKEGKRVIYSLWEYEPLLDSANMTVDDYARLARDIDVSSIMGGSHVSDLSYICMGGSHVSYLL